MHLPSFPHTSFQFVTGFLFPWVPQRSAGCLPHPRHPAARLRPAAFISWAPGGLRPPCHTGRSQTQLCSVRAAAPALCLQLCATAARHCWSLLGRGEKPRPPGSAEISGETNRGQPNKGRCSGQEIRSFTRPWSKGPV